MSQHVTVSTATGVPGTSPAAAATAAVFEKLVGLRQADLAAAIMGQADAAQLAAVGLERAEVAAAIANMTTEQLLAIRRRVDPTFSTIAPDTADYHRSRLPPPPPPNPPPRPPPPPARGSRGRASLTVSVRPPI